MEARAFMYRGASVQQAVADTAIKLAMVVQSKGEGLSD